MYVRLWGLIAVVALAGTACGSDGKASSRDADTSANALFASQWTLQEGRLGVPLDGVAVTARFTASRVTGSSGCNTYNGPVRIEGTGIVIGPSFASTEKACEPRVAAVETAYLALLPRATRFAVEGGRLTLSDASGDALLVYSATSANALLGKWNTTSLYTGNAVESVISGTEVTAEFTDTAVSGRATCNTYQGGYTTTADHITIGPLASTMMACAEPAEGAQEQHYLQALALAATWQVTGNKLTLLRADGGIAVTYDRAP